MKDIITYIPDLTSFRSEAGAIYETKGTSSEHSAAKFLSKDDDGNLLFNACQIPVKYNGNKSLCLVRTDNYNDLDGTLQHFEIIGECVKGSYVFRDGGKDKYEATYDTSPKSISDGSGGFITYTPPYMIGVFA